MGTVQGLRHTLLDELSFVKERSDASITSYLQDDPGDFAWSTFFYLVLFLRNGSEEHLLGAIRQSNEWKSSLTPSADPRPFSDGIQTLGVKVAQVAHQHGSKGVERYSSLPNRM
jgi:hypothetical protein